MLFWNPLTFILDKAVYTFFKISDFVFHGRKTKWLKKVHFWVNNPLKSTHSQAIQDLDNSEILPYITFSSMDHLPWMGRVRLIVQTAAKNITIIHN